MIALKSVLIRLLEIVGESEDYFVSGSLSFLPILGNYRQPFHDVDAAVSLQLFQRARTLLRAADRVRFLRLSEVAIAQDSRFARLLAPRTGFVHVDYPEGLLDLSCYRRQSDAFVFSLGAGFTLEIPSIAADHVQRLNWEGISYNAGPPELAFIPKAVGYLRNGAALSEPGTDPRHLEDLRRMRAVIDWQLIAELIDRGGIRWLGRRLPGPARSLLDPFPRDAILALQYGDF